MLPSWQIKIYKKLGSPQKIQDFLDSIPVNFEEEGETCLSPQMVLKKKKARCMEGAILAASIFRYHGVRSLVLDLRARRPDDDHVVTLFKQAGLWGAISKTNHAVLRFRDPIYRSIRELAMSYFHEYFDDSGKKNLYEYSVPLNLSKFDYLDWEVSSEDLWEIPESLDSVKHCKLLKNRKFKPRLATSIEIEAGKLLQYPDIKSS